MDIALEYRLSTKTRFHTRVVYYKKKKIYLVRFSKLALNVSNRPMYNICMYTRVYVCFCLPMYKQNILNVSIFMVILWKAFW